MINKSTFVIQLINMLVLYFIMRRYFFEPVRKFMEQRKEKIHRDLREAELKKNEAEKFKNKYKKQLASARDKAEEILVRAKRRGEKEKSEIISEAKREAASIIKRARVEIQREKTKAKREITRKAVELSLDAAAKLIEKDLDREEHKRFIQQYLKRIGDAQW